MARAPLTSRESGTEAEFLGPHEGVPDWLFNSLWEWLTAQLPPLYVLANASKSAEKSYRTLGVLLHVDLDQNRRGTDAIGLHDNLNGLCHEDPSLLLNAIDMALSHQGRMAEPTKAAQSLDGILAVGGSVYTVGDTEEGFELQRRTPDEARALLSAIGQEDAAGKLLTRAWSAGYSREPNPNEAYGWAIKAVEAAAIPVVVPDNKKATLGQIIKALRDKPEKWRVVFEPDDPGQQIGSVAGFMNVLWRGQFRHGEPGDEVKDQSLAEAEAAVHAAITLVQWFRSGAIARRES